MKQLQNILEARESITYFEAKYFPIWLLQLDCSRRIKWIICLEFGQSVYARVLKTRTGDVSNATEDMADTIVKINGDASGTCHPDVSSRVKFTNEEWDNLYKEFNLKTEDEKKYVRSLFSAVTSDEKSSMKWIDFS